MHDFVLSRIDLPFNVVNQSVQEVVSRAIDLVAILEPAGRNFSASQVITDMMAELVFGRLVHLLPVKKSDTVVLP